MTATLDIIDTEPTHYKRSLYDIDAELSAIERTLEDIEADPASVIAAVDFYLEENSDELQRKVFGYCALIKEMEARAAARHTERKRLAALAQVDENGIETLKARLLRFMQRHEQKKLDGGKFIVSRCANGGKLPLALDPFKQPVDWPDEYQKYVIELDTDKLREALESGAAVEGAELGERGEHVRIK